MTTALIAIGVLVPLVLGVGGWWALLMWGARKDGQFQQEHDTGGVESDGSRQDTADRED